MGAGAVGGSVAVRLARSGVSPVVIDTDPAHVASMRDPGLVLEGLGDGSNTRLDAHTTFPDGGPPDVVLLAVRSFATTEVAEALVPRLGERTDVVSLQNGLQEDAIAAAVGDERTIGCVVGFGATWLEPGRISLDADGDLAIGRLDGSADGRLDAVRELLGRAFRTRTTDNISGALWAKMLVNSMTVLGALGGMLTGELLVTSERRRLVAHVVAEGVDVATAEGVDLPDVFGLVPARFIHSRAKGWLTAMDRVLVRVGEAYGAIRSVTWRDIELGRRTEIDAVTGEMVRRGDRNGTPTPLNACVYGMLREIEAGRLRPDAANLEAVASVRAS